MLKALLLLGLVFVFFIVPINAQKKPPRAELKPSEKRAALVSNISTIPVFSDPIGAEVYLNNRLLGKTTVEGKLILGKNKPKTLTLKAGKYKFRFEHPDYQSDLRDVTVNRGEPSAVTGALKPKFGFLLLANLPKGASVILNEEPVNPKNFSWQDEGTLKLKAPLGEHQLKVSLTGYQPFINQYQIKDATPIAIGVELKRLLASLVVKSNPGARVYLDNQELGTISSEGRLVLTALEPQKPYRLVMEREGYKKYEKELTLVSERENVVEQPLSLLTNSSEFADSFESGLIFWDAPKEWKAEKGFLTINSKEVGLPKERNYCDAEVVFSLRLLNSRGAAWVVRAQDKENYYLFCLNAEGAYSNKLVTYICRNGSYDLTKPVMFPSPIPVQLKSNQTYRIRIIITGNVIQHFLTDNKTGDEFSIGLCTDEKNLFPCGNIGFVAPSGESFQAYGFVIKPNNPK